MAQTQVTTDVIADEAVTTAKIDDDAITAAKIDDNAVGAAAMADDAIGINELSATGTASGTTFLCGDNTWTAVGGAYSDWDIITSATNPLVVKGQYISNSASTLTHTLPAASAPGNVGDTIIMCNAGAGLVTIARNSSNINSAGEDGTLPQGNSVQLVYVSDAIGWFEV